MRRHCQKRTKGEEGIYRLPWVWCMVYGLRAERQRKISVDFLGRCIVSRDIHGITVHYLRVLAMWRCKRQQCETSSRHARAFLHFFAFFSDSVN
jgi:hypothetical protein